MSRSDMISRQSGSNRKLRILVVDDDPFISALFASQLIHEGFQVDTAMEGELAIGKILSGEKYDLIVLDIMMPKIDGLEVCKVIREKFSLSELPVLMLSALTDTKDIALGLKAGANDYATKPIKRNELIARVRDLLFIE